MNNDKEETIVVCCVKNCQKQIPKKEAMMINGNYFCKICGVAYYRSALNL